MAGFTKLFSTIVTSTIWREDDKTRILWITMLALAERTGLVPASIPGMANAAGMTIAECEGGLAKLMAPDPYSRTKTHEGRRVEVVESGFRIINYLKYREAARYEDRKEYLRIKQKEHRARVAALLTQKNVSTIQQGECQQNRPIAEADTEAKKGPKKGGRKSTQNARAAAQLIASQPKDADPFKVGTAVPAQNDDAGQGS